MESTFRLDAQVVFLFLFMGGYFLFKHAFKNKDKRLAVISYVLGFVFSAFMIIGMPLRTNAHYPVLDIWGYLLVILRFGTYGIAFGAIILIAYKWMLNYISLQKTPLKETKLSKISGNFFVLLIFFIICWLPIWIAFYPGSFTADSVTQFFEYYYNEFSTHHPIVHTLFLGYCMNLGIDTSAEGLPSVGLAIYSCVQLFLMSLIFAYALSWLRKQKAPLVPRLLLTVFFGIFPFFPLWNFSAQKDILFSALIMLFVILLLDIWKDKGKGFVPVFKMISAVFIAVVMMLLRNNGIYALCVALPFMIILFKGARIRIATVVCSSILLTILTSNFLTNYFMAEVPCKIELLSVPLQQISRTLKDNKEAINLDTDGVIDTLYDINPGDIYHPQISDPVKWAAHYSEVDENLVPLFKLWIKMGISYPKSYLEAFVVQNLPYFVPGSPMLYNFDLEVKTLELYPVENFNFMPTVKEAYSSYGKTLNFMGLPFVSLLSDTAFYVWLSLFLFGFAIYIKQQQVMAVLCFLFAIWLSCLAGPVAIIRYMLAFFYVVPVLFVFMSTSKN